VLVQKPGISEGVESTTRSLCPVHKSYFEEVREMLKNLRAIEPGPCHAAQFSGSLERMQEVAADLEQSKAKKPSLLRFIDRKKAPLESSIHSALSGYVQL